MTGLFLRSGGRGPRRLVHPSLLRVRDRACLRLLHRAEAATADQLATLVYGSLRTAQRRLRALWLAGLVERATLPPSSNRGGAPNAYRLSTRSRRLLGYRDLRRRQTHLRHALDCVEVVCSLLRSEIGEPSPVQVWLTEAMARGLPLEGVNPDGVVVLQLQRGSAVLCLEVDEATEHATEMRHKLAGYERALGVKHGWQVIFVVPSAGRASWVRRLAGREGHVGLRERAWLVELPDLRRRGLGAAVDPLAAPGPARPLVTLAASTRTRLCPTPVGSLPWLELLASGGAEDMEACLG